MSFAGNVGPTNAFSNAHIIIPDHTPPVQPQHVTIQMSALADAGEGERAAPNRDAAPVVRAAENDRQAEDRTVSWMVWGAGIGTLIGFGASMAAAYPEYLNTVDDLSANPYRDIGAKAKAEGKVTGIVIGASIGGCLIGGLIGYSAGNIANGVQRCCRWLRS